MMRATMVSISVKPASPPRLLFNAYLAGQPIDGDACPPDAVAQGELAAAGAAVGKEAHACQVGAELLGTGDLDVDRQAGGQGAGRGATFEPGAALADIDDERLINVTGLGGRSEGRRVGNGCGVAWE